MADNNPSWTGLTDQEAEEFHRYYIQGMMLFVAIAVVAHFLVWMWRPWIPAEGGYAQVIDGASSLASSVLPMIV
ncbi:MAG: light-harvesting antenna LH1, beta subunit [Pseudomonadota bacterium]